MTIHLVAHDAELHRLCLDILAEIPDSGHSCSIRSVSAEDVTGEADLHIWDFHPNFPLPEEMNWSPLRHLFLVDPTHLEVLRERIGGGDGGVLLKPVDRATLATILRAAISIGTAKSLRADREEILQCLIQTNLKLQEYDHERTTFLARALHDFRAPLTALSGYCGLLLSEPLGPLNESQNEVVRRMQNSARRLSRMVSAMFELSAGKEVKRRPDLRPGNLRECLQQALHEVAPFADEKSITITPDLSPGDTSLYFEAGLIEQVLVNLLDNACRYTPRAGIIEIRGYPYFWERRAQHARTLAATERRSRTSHAPNSYRVDISDSGAPLPDEHLDSIFEEHNAVAGARDRSGGGLGLAICKLIITQHHGLIWGENRDVGPVFSFVLPMRRSDPLLPLATAGSGVLARSV